MQEFVWFCLILQLSNISLFIITIWGLYFGLFFHLCSKLFDFSIFYLRNLAKSFSILFILLENWFCLHFASFLTYILISVLIFIFFFYLLGINFSLFTLFYCGARSDLSFLFFPIVAQIAMKLCLRTAFVDSIRFCICVFIILFDGNFNLSL